MKLIKLSPIALYLFILLANLQLEASQQKHIIGTQANGFFSSFLLVLNHLDWCDEQNVTPVVQWGTHSLYYIPEGVNGKKNVWEYFFEPVSDLMYTPGESIDTQYGKGAHYFYYNKFQKITRDRAHYLINKYIKVKSHVMAEVYDFYYQEMRNRKTIGIHLRGTDKKSEERPVSPEKIVKEALKYATKHTQFFIASDDKKLLDKMKKLLKKHRVIYYDSYRSTTGKPIHTRRPSSAQLGQEVLVEVLLLSKCDLLVHTLSNVSTGALYFNNALPEITVR